MKKVNSSIFKAYDIRGIYPDELDENVAYKVGRAIASYLQAKRIAVGRDMRLSSPQLYEALIEGITDQGADVDVLDLISTEMIYFAVGKYGYDGGVMVTASHNPKEYGGFKMVKNNMDMISGLGGMSQIKELVLKNQFEKPLRKGEVRLKDIASEWLEFISSFAEPERFKPLKIVIDAGNGMAGKFCPLVFKKLSFDVVEMYFELDGTFPYHLANPVLDENLEDIKKKIIVEGADLGVAFDGDGDRMRVLDEKGKPVSGDIFTTLIASEFLKKEKGARIVYNLTCSHVLPEEVLKAGGVPIRSRTGTAFMRDQMKKSKAIFGGEISGHYYFRDYFYSESPFIALLIFLKILSKSDVPLSELVKDTIRYFRTPEINIEMEDRVAAIKKLEEKYKDGKIDHLDGLTVEYKDWWFNARPSNTEPLLRVVVEAKTKELMEEKKKEILKIIS